MPRSRFTWQKPVRKTVEDLVLRFVIGLQLRRQIKVESIEILGDDLTEVELGISERGGEAHIHDRILDRSADRAANLDPT